MLLDQLNFFSLLTLFLQKNYKFMWMYIDVNQNIIMMIIITEEVIEKKNRPPT